MHWNMWKKKKGRKEEEECIPGLCVRRRWEEKCHCLCVCVCASEGKEIKGGKRGHRWGVTEKEVKEREKVHCWCVCVCVCSKRGGVCSKKRCVARDK